MAKFKVPAVIRKMLIEEAVYTMDDEAKKAIAAAEQPKP